MKHPLLDKAVALHLKADLPKFKVGDTVKVLQKVVEGSKVRGQSFEGTVIMKKGSGIAKSFTVRRISFGEGVEKTFPLHSPTVQSVTVTRQGRTRRAKLYYLRKKTGKQSRIEEADVERQQSEAAAV